MTRERSRSYVTKPGASASRLESGTVGGDVCGWKDLATWNSSGKASTRVEVVNDVVTPNFRSRMAAGEIICNPLWRTIIEEDHVQATSYSHEMRRTSSLSCSPSGSVAQIRKTEGTIVPPDPGFITFDTYPEIAVLRQSIIDLAVTDAYANIDTSSMLAGATVAEGRKTIDSMVDISWRAFRIFKAVKKLNFIALRKEIRPRELANRYMEYRYAIRPVIIDARNLIQATQRRLGYERKVYRGYASGSRTLSDTKKISVAWATSATWNRTYKYDLSVRAGVLCDVDVSVVNVAGLDQPLETMWELLPFSFMVDWFANVGSTLAAHTPNAGVKQRASWYTLRENTKCDISVVQSHSDHLAANWNSGTFSLGPAQATRNTLCIQRGVNPTLRTFPQVAINLDAWKLLDIGIILRNVFR